MNINELPQKCFIMALFIRDDGERFLLGSGAYEFKEGLQHFQPNTMANDVVEAQGTDGYLLAGQVRRPEAQSFDGYIGTATTLKAEVEAYRRDFFRFFAQNHLYQVVYVMPNKSAIQRRRGFIVDAPSVPEMWQIYPEYHVALNFEDVNYYEYRESADGSEEFGNSVNIGAAGHGEVGGLVWDELGVVWDSIGAVWDGDGSGTSTVIKVNSIDNVYPIWIVPGPAVNPTLTNTATATSMTYTGNVTESQVLRIDMQAKTATLNGVSVLQNVSGNWLMLAPGNNRLVYTTDNDDSPSSQLMWQEVVG